MHGQSVRETNGFDVMEFEKFTAMISEFTFTYLFTFIFHFFDIYNKNIYNTHKSTCFPRTLLGA